MYLHNNLRRLLLPILLFVAGYANAQIPQPAVRNNGVVTAVDYNLSIRRGLKIPVLSDTTHALIMAGIDSIGYIFKEYASSKVWVRDSNLVAGGHIWTQIGTGGGGGSDSGFQVLNATLSGVPIAKFVDGSGHRFVLYDTSTNPHALLTYGTGQKKIDSLSLVVAASVAAKISDSGLHAFVQPLPVGTGITVSTSAAKRFVLYDTAAGNTASIVNRARQQQITDSTFNVLNPQLALKAPLASPALTGNPTAPTQSPGDNTTKIATDAFVTNAVASAGADSGFALIYGTLSTGPIAKVISGAHRYLIVDTNRLGGNPFAMVTQSGLQKVVDSIYSTLVNTWYNDRADANSDSLAFADAFGNMVLRGEVDTSTDATVTITTTLGTNHTIIHNFHAAGGGASPGNPSGLVGMTASNGVAATFERSDATHAIDPAISPAWTGNHSWSNTLLPSAANTVDLGSLSLYFKDVYTPNWIAPNTANITSTGSNPVNIKINGVQKFSILSTGQQMDSAYIGNVFAGSSTTDSVLTINNGFVRKVPGTSFGGSLTRQSITSGTSATGTTITSGKLIVTFNFSSTAAAFNFTMPPSAFDGEEVIFESGGTLSFPTYEVTAMTVTANSGQAFGQTQALTTLQANEGGAWTYNISLNLWMRTR